jgi:hypothetical protein
MAALAVYLPALSVGYLSDDWGFVYQAEQYGWSAFGHNFNDPFFIPFSHVIGLFFYQLFQGNAVLFHGLQLVVHGAIAFQLFRLITQLAGREKWQFAVLAGIIFVVFPFQTEAVVWLAAKSYGYALFIMLLSIRAYIHYIKTSNRWFMVLFGLGTFVAIHCKELGYLTPIFAYLLARWTFPNSSQKLLIQVAIVIFGASLLLRFMVLGAWIGGYGETVHLPTFTTWVVHLGVWLLKLLAGTRLWMGESIQFVIGIGIYVSLFLLALRIKFLPHLGWRALLLLVVALLPILPLEITAYKSVEAERYGYVAALVVAVIWAYVITHSKLTKKWLLAGVLIIISGVSVQVDILKYQQANRIATSYLDQLTVMLDSKDSHILLLNIPDNFEGAYVLRNGIVPYLALQGKRVKVSYFSFETHRGAPQKSNDCLVHDQQLASPIQMDYYWTDHQGVKQFNVPFTQWDVPGWDEVDQVFYFCEGQVLKW